MTRRVDWSDDNTSWGGNVHHDPTGSWVPSAHGQEQS